MLVRKLRKVDEEGPLAATRVFLKTVWRAAEIDGMLLPVWSEESSSPELRLILESNSLVLADPFSPLNSKNSARRVIEQLEQSHGKKLGLVLRPCEQRCFSALRSRLPESQTEPLLITVDCLACYPEEDIDWRAEAVDNLEQITLDVLHFAAQGGLLPNRYRQSCQCCDDPTTDEADIHIEVLGLQTQDHLIVGFASEGLAKAVMGEDKHWGMIPTVLDRRRSRVLENIKNWRKQSCAYAIGKLDDTYKDLDTLIEHLAKCPNCQQRLIQDCPLLDSELDVSTSLGTANGVKEWLASCPACGMCEYLCPQGFPLFNTLQFHSLHQEA
jgi:formate dehydrogenase subunit beta